MHQLGNVRRIDTSMHGVRFYQAVTLSVTDPQMHLRGVIYQNEMGRALSKGSTI